MRSQKAGNLNFLQQYYRLISWTESTSGQTLKKNTNFKVVRVILVLIMFHLWDLLNELPSVWRSTFEVLITANQVPGKMKKLSWSPKPEKPKTISTGYLVNPPRCELWSMIIRNLGSQRTSSLLPVPASPRVAQVPTFQLRPCPSW